ncbi:diacylglycerol kinase family protein [Paludibacter sp. 221]|uniref:diacylglycerol kinase family protein n=1 Tax=Paludibacter sp. 221 TaxID=2302939 RepID=UPI0013D45D36|nr:diacylglycerol kinase family protein [Paludibacter sp. 221]NDV47167.1 diacylglycerol kinase family protein [Paludibacter sp. 221]
MNKRIKSFGYAFRGIWKAFATQPNMRIHLIVAVLVVICGFLFRISTIEWMFCLLCFGLVFGAELINSAIESVVDLASPEKNKLAGDAKDMAAGAVLVCAIFSAIVGLIIFVPKGWNLLFG